MISSGQTAESNEDPAIHFMDWPLVRADNTGLNNETGLVSWSKGKDTKVQLVTAFKAKLRDWRGAGPPHKKWQRATFDF